MLPPIELKIKAVIGFNGKVPNSLSYTPCGQYVVYPLGSFVVIKSLISDRESFMDIHTYDITCCKMTNDGRRLASGQSNIAGVKADVFIWDLEKAKEIMKYDGPSEVPHLKWSLHKPDSPLHVSLNVRCVCVRARVVRRS